jgi:hypothetical protein
MVTSCGVLGICLWRLECRLGPTGALLRKSSYDARVRHVLDLTIRKAGGERGEKISS